MIENRPDAGGRLGGRIRREPAGRRLHAVSSAASGVMSIAAAIYPKLAYHPTKSFMPLTDDRELSADPGEPGRRIRRRPCRSSSPMPRPIPTSRTTRHRRRPSRSRPSCSSSRPACPGSAIPLQEQQRDDAVRRCRQQCLFSIADGPPTVPHGQGRQGARARGDRRRSARRNCPTCRAWRRPDIPRSTPSCGAACSRRPRRRRADRQEARSGAAHARSRDPDVQRQAQGAWRSIPAAARRRNSAR